MAVFDSDKAQITDTGEATYPEPIMTEDEAIAYIESYLAKHLSTLFDEDEYSFRHSYEFGFNSLSKELQKRYEKLLSGSEKDIKVVERITERLRTFIREFCKAYVNYAPVPSDKFKYSTGRYFRSSIMYFTTDEASRTRALKKALAGSGSGEVVFGMKYVLDQLTTYRAFIRKGDVGGRIDRLLGGITIENVANTEHSSKYGVYFYGWRNVERYGWKFKNGKTKAPYSPFQHAINDAKRICHLRSNTTLVSDTIHEDMQDDGILNRFSQVNNLSKGYAS